jgi:TPR repeat protein
MITDKINHPPHYTAHPSGVECIQITEHFSFNIGNAIKYLWRADEKSAPLDDLRKAGWYIEREITRRINEANTITEIEFPKPAEKPVDYSRWLNLRALLIAAGRGDDQARRMADDILKNLERGSLYGLPPEDFSRDQQSTARRQYEMGNMCATGEGMPQDLDHAKEWWTLAAKQGHKQAQEALDGDALGIDAYSFLVAKSDSSPTPTQPK